MNLIFKKAMKEQKIGTRKFATYSHYSKNTLITSDRNRKGVYNLKNKDVRDRIPLYFPPGYTDFNKLPEEWNPHEAPYPGAEPTVYVIQLSGI